MKIGNVAENFDNDTNNDNVFDFDYVFVVEFEPKKHVQLRWILNCDRNDQTTRLIARAKETERKAGRGRGRERAKT